jgi:hypothetical protein
MKREQILDLMRIAAAHGDWQHYHKLKAKL